MPTEHKVTVRFCAGFECREPVTTHRVRQNIHGYREYCTLLCYARWPPSMRDVIKMYPEYEPTPYGLERLILDLKKEEGVQGTADMLGISRSTLSYWQKKLEAFRKFAGQDRGTIIALLHGVANTGGLPAAAELIAVDPKTLERVFNDLEVKEQAA